VHPEPTSTRAGAQRLEVGLAGRLQEAVARADAFKHKGLDQSAAGHVAADSPTTTVSRIGSDDRVQLDTGQLGRKTVDAALQPSGEP